MSSKPQIPQVGSQEGHCAGGRGEKTGCSGARRPKVETSRCSLAGSQAIRQLYRHQITDECKVPGRADQRSMGSGVYEILKPASWEFSPKQISTRGGSWHFAPELLPSVFNEGNWLALSFLVLVLVAKSFRLHKMRLKFSLFCFLEILGDRH